MIKKVGSPSSTCHLTWIKRVKNCARLDSLDDENLTVEGLFESLRTASLQNELENGSRVRTYKSPVRRSRALTVCTRTTLLESIQNITHPIVLNDPTAKITVVWKQTLNTTAGTTSFKRNGLERSCVISLGTKIIDSTQKLWNTYCHELCHAAMYLNDNQTKPPHGPLFKRYAGQLMNALHGVHVGTTHSYVIDYKYEWVCSTEGCGSRWQRHSRSINVERQRCGKCNGKLVQIRPKPRATPRKAFI